MEDKGIEKVDSVTYRIKKGFVPNMRTEAYFFVNDDLKEMVFEELKAERPHGSGGFLPAVCFILNSILRHKGETDSERCMSSRNCWLFPWNVSRFFFFRN